VEQRAEVAHVVGVDVTEDNGGPVSGQMLDDRPADPTTATRDNCDFAL
jgi:hypothetical protein